ncbi:MAG: hypothetical protein R3B45_01950 [Bdellovibrionota bacterium]
MNSDICSNLDNPQKKQYWNLSLTSPIGNHHIKITLPTPSSSTSSAESHLDSVMNIDDQTFNFSSTKQFSPQFLLQVCNSWKHHPDKPISADKKQIEEVITAWLQAASRDCNFSFTDTWQCQLPQANNSTKPQLDEIQKKMIQKWSRHPYLFTRKLTVSRKLSKMLSNRITAPEAKKFCKILKNSLIGELPISFANQKWQKAICSDMGQHLSEQTRHLISIALHDAVSELHFLNDLVEDNSRLGIVQLKLPPETAPSRNLWISLTPENVIPEQVDSSSTKTEAGLAVNKYFSCWHPLYSQSSSLMKLAATAKILQDGEAKLCQQSNPSEENKPYPPAEKWVIDSITGDTEFIVTNGNAKILRLPTGTYSYTIHALPKNATQWQPSEADETSSGKIDWTARRPSTIIKTW